MTTPYDPFAPASADHPHAAAVKALHGSEPRLAALIARVGPCRLAGPPAPPGAVAPDPAREHFVGLVTAIVSQQLSSKAAATIFGRVRGLVPGDGFEPAGLLAVPVPRLREAGLSAAKAASVRDLAARVHEGRLRLDVFDEAGEEEVIEALCAVRGIGRWTAEMFLMFRLGRLDVLPVADLGIQKGFEALFNLRKRPDAARMEKLARPFRPYRSVACWYLWRLGDLPPDEVKGLRKRPAG